jgi:hypothetical protein
MLYKLSMRTVGSTHRSFPTLFCSLRRYVWSIPFYVYFLFQFFRIGFYLFGQVIQMDQGAGCQVCYQPPCFCSGVSDNTSHFTIKIVEDDFEDGVVSSYIFFINYLLLL